MAHTGRSTARGLERVPRRMPVRVPADEAASAAARKVKRRERIRYKFFTLGLGLDMPMLFLILVLLAVGLVMLFSASYAYAYYYFGNSYHFVMRQGMFAIAGVVLMLLISTVDYHQLHKFNLLIFGISVVLLVMVLAFKGTAIAPVKGGANRWIDIGVEFQPSEIAKFALILMFAHLISLYGSKMNTFRYGFLPFAGILAIIAGLVILEKHVSATLIICLIAFLLMFIGGTKMRYFVVIGTIGGVALVCVLLFSDKFAYALERIQGWLDPFNPPEGVDTWQTVQSLYAIGSGQLLGVGIGQSRQKYLYLPEPQNDFIFAIICEELGFIGALIVIILFALFIWRGVYISLHARDRFGTMLGLGITFQFGIQAIFNICVVTNTFPNTGISLPFFSYGGTALIMLLAEMGVLLSISRHSNIEKT
ncbi:putative lipid II flippase FtsW [Anaeromassilibacillus senegalensis]|nr:putative lipid II flippase FtsW [Anaeromassilibacillus senegalensis]MDD7645995.1 putative lipid II flippase FtsW [Ruminococcus bromii]